MKPWERRHGGPKARILARCRRDAGAPRRIAGLPRVMEEVETRLRADDASKSAPEGSDDLDGDCMNRCRGYTGCWGTGEHFQGRRPDGRSGKEPCAKLPGVHRAALSRYGAMRRRADKTPGVRTPMHSRRTRHDATGGTP